MMVWSDEPINTPEPAASPESAAAKGGASLRGISLLAIVFEELSTQLGHEFSTAELMQAAQRLIDLSKQEYVEKNPDADRQHATFYSMNLVSAFESHSWHIASTDTSRLSHCDFDDVAPEAQQNAILLMRGSGEKLWEF